MKWFMTLISMAAIALALSATGFAKNNKDSGSFDLAQAAKVGTTELQPGHYKADWMPETGNKVKVDIERNGKTVASADAHIKELPKPSNDNAVTTQPLTSTSRQVVEIDFSGQRDALIFGS